MLELRKNKTNEINFSMPCKDYIAGSKFIFMGKLAYTDADADALFVKTSDDGILFSETSFKGVISLAPSDTDTDTEGIAYADLQMVSPAGAVYVVGELQIRLVNAVNVATLP